MIDINSKEQTCKNIVWIARDPDGMLDMFFEFPERVIIKGYGPTWGFELDNWSGMVRSLDNSLLPELTWDDEPIKGILYQDSEGKEWLEIGREKIRL